MTRNLQDSIEDKSARVCIMGAGYVGLPLAVIIARSGYKVTCGEISDGKIDLLNHGLNPQPDLKEIDETELKRFIEEKRIIVTHPESAAADAEVKIICVPTPKTHDKKPDLTNIEAASTSIGRSLKRDDLVVNESTLAPGMTREVIGRILEETSALKAGEDFYLVASPERADPGNTIHTVERIPKVLGGIDDRSTDIGRAFYQKFIHEIITVSSLEAAEATKMLENSYRALNIGFINEFARFCDASGIDVMEVIRAASTKWSFQPHYPGIGVGGHCIPKDPYYLMSAAEKLGVELETLYKAMLSSESMPYYVFNHLKEICAEMELNLKGVTIALFGISYKRNTRDLRDSPALIFQHILEQEGIDVQVYDPLFSEKELRDLNLKVFDPRNEPCDIVVIGCDHSQFKSFDFKRLRGLKAIIDGKNMLPKQHVPVIGVGAGAFTVRERCL